MDYKNLKDHDLQESLKVAVKKERHLLSQILEMLCEIEDRRLFAKRGYPSLHAYCTEFLGYSDGSAHRRISSMRLMREMPEVKQKIETGELQLSNLSKAASFFRQEEKVNNHHYSTQKKAQVLKSLERKSQKEAERSLVRLSPKVFQNKVSERPLSEEVTELKFTIDSQTLEQLNRLKELKPNMNTKELFLWMLERNLKQIDPLKKNTPETKRPRAKAPRKNKKLRKHIPQATRQQVWQKAKGRCQFKDHLTGKFCHSSSSLEVDHIQPLILGGTNSAQNLRLLCREHHKQMTLNSFGRNKKIKSFPQRK